MTMQIHMVASIDGSLKLSDRMLSKLYGMSARRARAELLNMKKRGMEFIPNSKCKNPLPDGSCPGHEEDQTP
jgi:hypothetical protein